MKNLVALAPALFVAGRTVPPLMVTAIGPVERIVPRVNRPGEDPELHRPAGRVALGCSADGWVVGTRAADAATGTR